MNIAKQIGPEKVTANPESVPYHHIVNSEG